MATSAPPTTDAGSSSGIHAAPHLKAECEVDDAAAEDEPLLMSVLIRDESALWLDQHEQLNQTLERNGRVQLFESQRMLDSRKYFCFSVECTGGTPIGCLDFIRVFRENCTYSGPASHSRCIYWLYMGPVNDKGKADFQLDIHHPLDPPPKQPLEPFISPTLNGIYRLSKLKPVRLMQLDRFDHLLKPSTIPDISAIQMPNTVNLPMSPQPALPFMLKLYDYQRRTLGWMENVEDGHDSVYYNPNMILLDDDFYFERPKSTSYYTSLGQLYSFEEAKQIAPSVKSGIIADKPGVGKTITTLALCQTRPYRTKNFLYTLDPLTQRFKSKATVIFVPNNIASQWMTEIKKCFGSNINAIEIKGKRGYEATTLKQILECDIVVVSYNFLTNVNYIAEKITSRSRLLYHHAPELDFNVKATAKKFIDKLPAGKYAFSWIHFHRVVFDEFHEIDDKHRAIKTQLGIMKGDVMWGLTGTPKVDNHNTVATFATYLNIHLSDVWSFVTYSLCSSEGTMISSKEFLLNRVRRNEPEIHYPPPIYQTIRVNQTAMEMSLYRSSATNDNRANMENLVKLCNHYQIGNNLNQETGSETLTIQQVTQRVQTDRSTKINQLTKQIENQVKVIERRRQVMDKAADNQARQAALISYRKAISDDRRMKEELRSTQSQFNFFQNFLNTYGTEDNNIFCSVCWNDDIPKDELALVPCGHVFCWECAEGVVNHNQKCPQCMTSIRRDQIMKLRPPAPAMEVPGPSVEQKENDDGDKLDPDKFGSKIRELVEYLQREMAEDENNRFLVFIQWSDLADLVSQALNTFGIATARLKSGFTQREAALKQFRAGLPEGSFVKVEEADADDEVESKVENDGTKREIKQETVNTNSVETELIPLKKDVKGKGRAVPLDLEAEDVQQLPPVRAVRKKRPATVFVSDSDDSEPEVGMTEEKNETHLATTSAARPGKKPRTEAIISEDDLSTVKLDPNAPNDEFEESPLDVKTVKKKRVTVNEVESKSMKRERKYKAVKVLMLSAKDSVSGLNLTEATHCIIMHPFHDNKEEYAIGAEKQGVARTLRNGQTKTVKIVRFVVERTVEQEMHDRRVDKLKD